MKTKQRTARLFEIECEDVVAVEKYISKNKALLDGLIVALKGSKASDCIKICNSHKLCYAVLGECQQQTSSSKAVQSKLSSDQKDLFDTQVEQDSSHIQYVEKVVEKVVIQTVYVEKEDSGNTVESVHKDDRIVKNNTMRSGEDIATTADVAIFARVNSGAKIKSDGCVEIFDTIDGLVECNGPYMIIKSIDKGTVVFNGTKIDSTLFNGRLKKVSLVDGKIEIKEL